MYYSNTHKILSKWPDIVKTCFCFIIFKAVFCTCHLKNKNYKEFKIIFVRKSCSMFLTYNIKITLLSTGLPFFSHDTVGVGVPLTMSAMSNGSPAFTRISLAPNRLSRLTFGASEEKQIGSYLLFIIKTNICFTNS